MVEIIKCFQDGDNSCMADTKQNFIGRLLKRASH